MGLPATNTSERAPPLNPSQPGRYSIYLPKRDWKLGWPGWLVPYQDGLPARRQSAIQVVTGPGVKQVTALPLHHAAAINSVLIGELMAQLGIFAVIILFISMFFVCRVAV